MQSSTVGLMGVRGSEFDWSCFENYDFFDADSDYFYCSYGDFEDF